MHKESLNEIKWVEGRLIDIQGGFKKEDSKKRKNGVLIS